MSQHSIPKQNIESNFIIDHASDDSSVGDWNQRLRGGSPGPTGLAALTAVLAEAAWGPLCGRGQWCRQVAYLSHFQAAMR